MENPYESFSQPSYTTTTMGCVASERKARHGRRMRVWSGVRDRTASDEQRGTEEGEGRPESDMQLLLAPQHNSTTPQPRPPAFPLVPTLPTYHSLGVLLRPGRVKVEGRRS